MDYYRTFNGYVLYTFINGVKAYVTGYKNGIYNYTLDYTNARKYSKKTALQHINRFNNGGKKCIS